MDLKTFLKKIPAEGRDEFAGRCGTTWAFLRNVAYGQRRAGESLCINIERESFGSVRCEQLRPDVDWEFIRGTARHRHAA